MSLSTGTRGRKGRAGTPNSRAALRVHGHGAPGHGQPGLMLCCWAVPGSAGLYRAVPSCTELCRALPGSAVPSCAGPGAGLCLLSPLPPCRCLRSSARGGSAGASNHLAALAGESWMNIDVCARSEAAPSTAGANYRAEPRTGMCRSLPCSRAGCSEPGLLQSYHFHPDS